MGRKCRRPGAKFVVIFVETQAQPFLLYSPHDSPKPPANRFNLMKP
jgi:hypothetical protein